MTRAPIIKLRILFRFWLSNPVGWYHDVWKQNPWERLCCDGHQCGCRGSDHYEWWDYLLKKPRTNREEGGR